MTDPIEVKVTVHFPEEPEKKNQLYTIRVDGNAEYLALLKRLAGYAYHEEKADHAHDLINHEDAVKEKEYLEWRIAHLNTIIDTALN